MSKKIHFLLVILLVAALLAPSGMAQPTPSALAADGLAAPHADPPARSRYTVTDLGRLGPRSGSLHSPHAVFTVNNMIDAVDAAPGNGVCATAGSVCTLRAAIQEANALAGDDLINLPAGSYTVTLAGTNEDAAATGDLDLTSNITFNGTGAETTIVNGGYLDRVFHVTGAFTVNLANVTITHGNGSGGGIRNDGGAVTITDSAFSDNATSSFSGGGGGILNSGTLTITDSTFTGNSAGSGADGGGIFNSGRLTIANNAFAGNSVGSGADGGGVFNSGTLAITNSAFSNNSSGNDGGAILNSSTLTVTRSVFSDNSSGNDGGAILSSGTLTINGSTFSGNSAGNGGGIYDGGGIITITHSTFAGNSASSGGGIFTQFNATIANSTFADNSAFYGDDLYTDGGALAVINSTIFGSVPEPDRVSGAGNSPASGGGIYNSAAGGGSVTLFNTIVAGHESGGNCVGVITNGGHNLDDGTTCGWGAVNGSLSNANPALGALTGSPAYLPLNLNSLAIDTGNNATCAAAPVNNTSQNGVTRPTDGDGNGTATCDIGAFERSSGFKVYLPYIVK